MKQQQSARWAQALYLAGTLGVAPHQFWKLSLVEWQALTRGAPGGGQLALSRRELIDLMQHYPDEGSETDDARD